MKARLFGDVGYGKVIAGVARGVVDQERGVGTVEVAQQ